MARTAWGAEVDAWLVANPAAGYADFLRWGGDPERSKDAFDGRRRRLGLLGALAPKPGAPLPTEWDKKAGEFDWREANRLIAAGQDLRHRASASQTEARIAIDADRPVSVLCLGDTHIGAWSADHDLLERITDELLSIPDLYVILLGDAVNNAIKLRGVAEVKDDFLPPDLQAEYLASWLREIAPRVLFAVWGNHEARAEEQAGANPFAALFKQATVYFSGIGHADVTVGGETYRIAASHHFQGRSIYNPAHGPQRYLVMQGHDREIAVAGDSHVPGVLAFVHGATRKLAINTGSSQTESAYARRFFSLTTHPVFPVLVLDPHRHDFHAYWSLGQYLRRAA